VGGIDVGGPLRGIGLARFYGLPAPRKGSPRPDRGRMASRVLGCLMTINFLGGVGMGPEGSDYRIFFDRHTSLLIL